VFARVSDGPGASTTLGSLVFLRDGNHRLYSIVADNFRESDGAGSRARSVGIEVVALLAAERHGNGGSRSSGGPGKDGRLENLALADHVGVLHLAPDRQFALRLGFYVS
jgi:hypothetical protein